MKIHTDDIEFAAELVPDSLNWRYDYSASAGESLLNHLFETRKPCWSEGNLFPYWKELYLVKHARSSQYDRLIELSHRNAELSDGIVCIAGSGDGFHGFKNRRWVTLPGNVHLSAYMSPRKNVESFHIGFTILSAVSVIQTLDRVSGLEGRAGIKWVNDILIDGAKVCGVLAQTQSQGSRVTGAVIGIGLNVENSPITDPTPFVPTSACLRDFVSNPDRCKQNIIFENLVKILASNYQKLISGKFKELLEVYRQRSIVVGRNVTIYSDDSEDNAEIIRKGKVKSIGNNLELFFEEDSGPIFKGRLVI
ncbi:MAG: biotin--[acetyl-CoA-carboxylase] ligase [candidate division Zixibacteria bacterium]|nr:biotin--[acetyl-CoA-carboxylase] ligase [candidate division Zixibacteria bacterium]